MIKNYTFYKANLKNYPNTADKMSDNYLNLFVELMKEKNDIVKKRRILSSPILLIKNLIFLIIFLIKNLRNSLHKIISK